MTTTAEILGRAGLNSSLSNVAALKLSNGEWVVWVGYRQGASGRSLEIADAALLAKDLRKHREHRLADLFEAASDTARRQTLHASAHNDYVSRLPRRAISHKDWLG